MKNNVIEIAKSLAKTGHEGQKRKDGKPYFSHVEAVAAIVEKDYLNLIPVSSYKYWLDLKEKVVAAGYLHDLLEDTDYRSRELLRAGIPALTVSIVNMVTRRAKETYFDFIMRIHNTKATARPGAIAVKLADLRHNMSDLKEGSLKDKYRFAEFILLNGE